MDSDSQNNNQGNVPPVQFEGQAQPIQPIQPDFYTNLDR